MRLTEIKFNFHCCVDHCCSDIGAAEVASAIATDQDQAPPPNIILKKKKFVGKYAISADEFTPDLV